VDIMLEVYIIIRDLCCQLNGKILILSISDLND
jgi:hypothetical protein